ncbi:MAG: HlyC/CorC family transporter [Candidatus Sericytochromatia bacterium]|nr:HlyC/CorC family transporter [Candidatus Tanganyikabacteria bacterium]
MLAALFSAAEAALTGLNRVKLRQRLDEGIPAAKLVADLSEHPQRLMSTVLLVNTLSTVIVAVLGAHVSHQILAGSRYEAFSALIAIAVLAPLVLVVGEIVPKSVATARAQDVAEWIARPVSLVMAVLRPLVGAALVLAMPFIRLLGGREALATPRYTEEELRTLVEIGEEQGALEDVEATLVTSALAFDDTTVDAVLTPRVDIVAIPEDAPLESVLKLIAEQGYSRLPVIRENVDDIIGILHVKDLLVAMSRREPIDLAQWIRPAYSVPENKKLHELLKEMQQQGIEMAIVSDEYGGTAGLVTQEDILEQIVGELRDEYDEEQDAIRRIRDGLAQADGMTAISELNDTLGIELPVNGYQTIGGLVINSLGRVARVGDVVEPAEGVKVTVKSLKGIRVQQVLVEYQTGIDGTEP